ncbi:MAG: hypothetical protein JOY65_13490 [Acetobacteraceae bacterium]|nr:hypothetical protein [Acetobacteraceae bacterium]
MRWIILSMLSSASLSAFSASVLKAGFGAVQPPSPALRPFGAQPQSAAPSAAPSLPPQGARAPGGAMPRGSLLDLSV